MFSANADVITGVTATATTENEYRKAAYLVDGSGLTGNQHGTYPGYSMWLSAAASPRSVVFDLCAVYDVSQLKLKKNLYVNQQNDNYNHSAWYCGTRNCLRGKHNPY